MQRDASLGDSVLALMSKNLFPLGAELPKICAEMASVGLGGAAEVARERLERLAGSSSAVDRLWTYWIEVAKERTAALVGPMNLRLGDLPSFSAYRSKFLADLRSDTESLNALGVVDAVGYAVIEPTLRRYAQMSPKDEFQLELEMAARDARRESARALAVADVLVFERASVSERMERLSALYSESLCQLGFKVRFPALQGTVFEKTSSCGRWSMLLVDESRETIEFGMIGARLVLVQVGRKIVAGRMPVAATFAFDDFIPRFVSSRMFAAESYAEFVLSVRSMCWATNLLCTRIDGILTSMS